jgi:hypothetical protein
MKRVTEVMTGEPFDRPERVIERNETQLFQAPSEAAMRFLVRDLPPLAVYSVPVVYEPAPFARPQGVFEGAVLRLEWQTLDGRQPFYHRNADVDEISYQICGGRTLLTECGTVEFGVGQFSRIPVGVAHDNYGRQDIHLIFYLHGPAVPGLEPVGRSKYLVPPFPGWEAKVMIENLTDNMGAPGGSIAFSMADEELLLGAAKQFNDPLELLEPSGPAGQAEWVYRGPKVWIGHTRMDRTQQRRYQRRVCGHEIQYQAAGVRTVVSQRGVVTLNPGDFTCIPAGCASASLTDGPSRHLSIVTSEPVPPVKEAVRRAEPDVAAWLADQDARREGAVQ